MNTETKYLTKSHAAKVWIRKHARALGGGWFELPGGKRVQGRKDVANRLIAHDELRVNCKCTWRQYDGLGGRRFCSTCPAQFVEADSK